jgi:putative FmdB family regulatory protein
MPIFEYLCRDCKKSFEALLYGSQRAQCPHCQGSNLDQQISVFSVGGSARLGPSACPMAGSCDAADGGDLPEGCPSGVCGCH